MIYHFKMNSRYIYCIFRIIILFISVININIITIVNIVFCIIIIIIITPIIIIVIVVVIIVIIIFISFFIYLFIYLFSRSQLVWPNHSKSCQQSRSEVSATPTSDSPLEVLSIILNFGTNPFELDRTPCCSGNRSLFVSVASAKVIFRSLTIIKRTENAS
jgi:energy-coupling factor transporter transmembrane protein EcfT